MMSLGKARTGIKLIALLRIIPGTISIILALLLLSAFDFSGYMSHPFIKYMNAFSLNMAFLLVPVVALWLSVYGLAMIGLGYYLLEENYVAFIIENALRLFGVGFGAYLYFFQDSSAISLIAVAANILIVAYLYSVREDFD